MVASPCVKTCRIDPKSMLCVGCGRTLDEIQKWLKMPEKDKRHTLDLIAERRRGGKPMIPPL
jgi:predicted Fe-S protein YdhL (DUF1289 family)